MSASSDRLGLFSELICGGRRIYGITKYSLFGGIRLASP